MQLRIGLNSTYPEVESISITYSLSIYLCMLLTYADREKASSVQMEILNSY